MLSCMTHHSLLVIFETRLSFLAVSFNLAVTNVKNSFKSHVNSYNAKTEAEQCCEKLEGKCNVLLRYMKTFL